MESVIVMTFALKKIEKQIVIFHYNNTGAKEMLNDICYGILFDAVVLPIA